MTSADVANESDDIFTYVHNNDIKKVEELLIKNKDLVNHKSSDELVCTPLFKAAYKGHVDMCKLLVKYGANVNEKDFYGVVPLMCAAIKDRVDTVKYLIEVGADIHVKAEDEQTALSMAISFDSTNTVDYLRSIGCTE